MTTPKRTKRINLSLSDELYNKIKVLTDRLNVPMATWCTIQVATIVDSYEELLKQYTESMIKNGNDVSKDA